MNNSTTVAATIGVSALGVLAYYGYQNINKNEETLYNEIDGVEKAEKEPTDLQNKAKDEVKKVIDNVTHSWSGFWKNEYNDIKNEKIVAAEE